MTTIIPTSNILATENPLVLAITILLPIYSLKIKEEDIILYYSQKTVVNSPNQKSTTSTEINLTVAP